MPKMPLRKLKKPRTKQLRPSKMLRMPPKLKRKPPNVRLKLMLKLKRTVFLPKKELMALMKKRRKKRRTTVSSRANASREPRNARRTSKRTAARTAKRVKARKTRQRALEINQLTRVLRIQLNVLVHQVSLLMVRDHHQPFQLRKKVIGIMLKKKPE